MFNIIQHNVLHWHTHKHTLSNTYLQESPDIILINSHGQNNDTNIKIFGYTVHQINTTNSLHNGVAIAVKNNLKNHIDNSFESDMLAVTIETQQGPINIATTYSPPRQQYLHLPDFYKLIHKQHPTYIIGDLNAANRQLGYNYDNNKGKQISTLVNRGHLTHLGPHFPTYINNRSATTPDIILANRKTFHNIHITPGTLIHSSDHNYIKINISTNPIQIPILERKSMKKADWQTYKEKLLQNPTINLRNATYTQIEEATVKWTEQIKKISDQTIPTSKYKTIPHIKTNNEIRNLQILYTAIINQINRHGTNNDIYTYLLNIRTSLQEKLREKYIEDWTNIIKKLSLEKNPKKFWQSIKKLSGDNSRPKAQHLKDHENNNVYKPENKEQIFRNYWENKIFKITEEENANFDERHEILVTNHNENHTDILEHSLTFDHNRDVEIVTIEDIKSAINTTKQRSPGKSGITKLHLANIPPNMIENFAQIINSSLNLGYFPKVFKHAIMIFIPKPNKTPTLHTNYRPISLLEVPAKIYEKIINNRLRNTLEVNNQHNMRQHGFRQKRGTDTALAILYENISKHKANKQNVEIIFRDVQKAFDKVWHEGLKYKIINIRIPQYLKRIICNYLDNRTTQIRINTYTGPSFNITCGVPQGGCLSPTLFNIFTHDIPPPAAFSDYIQYADDITQIHAHPSKSTEMRDRSINRAINKVIEFENKWKIKSNQDKFKILNIGNTTKRKIKINKYEIKHATSEKVLGLTLKSTGIVQHITNRINMAKVQLSKLKRFSNFPSNLKRTLYLTLVRSKLIYPPIPLHTASKTQLTRLQRVQNQATRFISGKTLIDRHTSEHLHTETNLTPINIVLTQSAAKTWTHILETFPREITRNLFTNNTHTPAFPSSMEKAIEDIEPIYN